MPDIRRRKKVARRRARTSDRDRELHVRCTSEDLARWRRAANSCGLSLSYWVCYELRAAASEDEERMLLRRQSKARPASAQRGGDGTEGDDPTTDSMVPEAEPGSEQ